MCLLSPPPPPAPCRAGLCLPGTHCSLLMTAGNIRGVIYCPKLYRKPRWSFHAAMNGVVLVDAGPDTRVCPSWGADTNVYNILHASLKFNCRQPSRPLLVIDSCRAGSRHDAQHSPHAPTLAWWGPVLVATEWARDASAVASPVIIACLHKIV